MAEKEVNIIIESPWKKIIIVGIIIIAFVIITELLSKYFENLSLLQLNLIYTSNYFIYGIIFLVIISAILIFIYYNKKKKETENNKKNGKINITDREVKKVLMKIDSLLEKLPKDEINKFAKSEDAKFYKAVLKKYGVK